MAVKNKPQKYWVLTSLLYGVNYKAGRNNYKNTLHHRDTKNTEKIFKKIVGAALATINH